MWHPFDTQMERCKVLAEVRQRQLPSIFTTTYPKQSELICSLLNQDPSKRPNAEEIVGFIQPFVSCREYTCDQLFTVGSNKIALLEAKIEQLEQEKLQKDQEIKALKEKLARYESSKM